MAEVKVYYNEDCPACPPYLDNLRELTEKHDHTCEIFSLGKDPLIIIEDLQFLRDQGHSVTVLPFFVVSDEENKYSYEGILSKGIISEVLSKFGS